MPPKLKKVEDFKKVKLKIGKKLKKPTETNTTFKAGKVILLEQLKRGSVGNEIIPATKRKLTLADLIHHLRHYNANVRKDGINGLKELLQENPFLIRSNLSALMENLGPLMADTESDILKSSYAVWEIILSTVDSASLSPYFPLIAAHTNCAMTHLNARIKKFALKVLNLLVQHHGDLLRSASAFELIRCFMNSLPHSPTSTSPATAASVTLLSRSSKYEVLKTTKNILSLFNGPESSIDDCSLKNSVQIDCRQSSSAIISVSLSAAEFATNTFGFDDYVRPLGTAPNEMDRYLTFFNYVVPFCHSFWIEVTSMEDQTDVDCFTLDLSTLVIMNDILFIYNSLLRRPLDLSISAESVGGDSDVDNFKNTVRKTLNRNLLDRYFGLLPCRRAARKSGEAALVEGNSNMDVCSSVNFNLCRFLTYVSYILGEKQFQYPAEKISEYLAYSLSGEKKRADSQTARCALELARDLRSLISDAGHSVSRRHYRQLGELITDSLLKQSSKWKVKVDILSWLCQDLENLISLDDWPRFGEFVQQLPSILSSILDESKSASTKVDQNNVFALVYRLVRILVLRHRTLPLERNVVERTIKTELLTVVMSNLRSFPSTLKKEILNLIFYLIPLKAEVIEVIMNLAKDGGLDANALKALLR